MSSRFPGRLLEFVVLYFGIPSVLAWGPRLAKAWFGLNLRVWVIPTLLVLALAVLAAERVRGKFDPAELFRCRVPAREWIRMLTRFAALAAVLTALLWMNDPAKLFVFPRRNPMFWAAVMVGYPLLSVSAQGVLYRWLYERRYAGIFPGRGASLLAGAAAFSFAHVLFHNPVALVFTFVGGLFFLRSYRRTGSVVFSDIEHALFGDFLFTVGWGAYFFEGTQRLLQSAAGG